MEIPPHPQVISAERLRNGVVITFSDGRCAIFPDTLLLSLLPQAIEILDTPDDEP